MLMATRLRRAAEAKEHALSVLGLGQITLTLIDGDRRIVVSRSANETAPRVSGPFLPPIILSQTEIETVGLQPGGRLRLLDGFLGDQRSTAAAEAEAMASVRSLTAEANTIRQDIEQLNAQLSQLPSIEAQLEQLAPQEQQLASLSADAHARTGQLSILSRTIAAKGVAAAGIQRFHVAVSRWRATLANAQNIGVVESWPADAGGDPLVGLRTRVANAHQHIAYALQELAAVEAASGQITASVESEKIGIEDQARQLRRDIEGLQSGAGEIVRRGQTLRERKAQLDSLRGVLAARSAATSQAIARRSAALNALEAIRAQRYETRALTAAHLNQVLGPLSASR